MAVVIWTDAAIADLRGIVEYIAADSHRYAEAVGNSIIETADALLQFPRIGEVVREYRREDIRELSFGQYRIVYKAEDEACFIVAVLHRSMDLVRHTYPDDWNLS